MGARSTAARTLGELASRYVDVGALDWTATGQAGVDWKILFRDDARADDGARALRARRIA
jgi:hypothetical protein